MLIMENCEEVLQILERYSKLSPKEIPKELDDYLCYVAKTGDILYRWIHVKALFRDKLICVIKEFYERSPIDDLPQYPNVDPFNYESLKSALLERLELFSAAPFTVQRLCELLTDPKKQYTRIDKFMRALEKNILVVSTIEPARKPAGNENGDVLDSAANGNVSPLVSDEMKEEVGASIFNVSHLTNCHDTKTLSGDEKKTASLDMKLADNTDDKSVITEPQSENLHCHSISEPISETRKTSDELPKAKDINEVEIIANRFEHEREAGAMKIDSKRLSDGISMTMTESITIDGKSDKNNASSTSRESNTQGNNEVLGSKGLLKTPENQRLEEECKIHETLDLSGEKNNQPRKNESIETEDSRERKTQEKDNSSQIINIIQEMSMEHSPSSSVEEKPSHDVLLIPQVLPTQLILENNETPPQLQLNSNSMEVMLHSEADTRNDVKNYDSSGMDIDDNSQGEAMDQ